MGIGLSMLIVMITVTVSLLASLSAIGLCERLRTLNTGGVYYLVSRVLGGKLGGTVGVMYAFGLVNYFCDIILAQFFYYYAAID